MKQFNTFYIHKTDYDLQEWTVVFNYSFDNKQYFKEIISLDLQHPFREDINKSIVENILFHISIAFWISYYKLSPTKNIVVDSGNLNQEQTEYWKDFYIQWLGEFFYTNNINFSELCNFSWSWISHAVDVSFPVSEKYLLPIWGWKDSIVSSLLLKENNISATSFVFWKIDTIKQSFLDLDWSPFLNIQRKLDPKLLEMNSQWYFNGHVPITWLISFFLTFVCYIYDYKYIVFSNEKSANMWNTHVGETEINHQYSKSWDFEEKLSRYIHEYISTDISYSSLLREYYEIEIAKFFAEKWKKYFSVFSSCNKNFSITKTTDKKWCNNCPKCLFVYIILRPYITSDETIQIFWEELYDRKDLQVLFSEIVWISGIKPFECVWEIEEAQLWVYLSLSSLDNDLPYLLEYFKEHFSNIYNQEYFLKLRKKYNV